jgi:hypothetical protein
MEVITMWTLLGRIFMPLVEWIMYNPEEEDRRYELIMKQLEARRGVEPGSDREEGKVNDNK